MSLQPIHWIMGVYCTLTYQQSLGEENSASDSRDGPRVETTVKTTRRYSSRIGETLSTITHSTKGSKGQQFEINKDLGCWLEVWIVYDVCILTRDNLRLPQLTSVFFEWTPQHAQLPTTGAWIYCTPCMINLYIHQYTSYKIAMEIHGLLWYNYLQMVVFDSYVKLTWITDLGIIKGQLLEIGTWWHLI